MSRLSGDDVPAIREDVLALKADIRKMYRDMKYDTLLIVGSVSLIQTLIYYAIIILATSRH